LESKSVFAATSSSSTFTAGFGNLEKGVLFPDVSILPDVPHEAAVKAKEVEKFQSPSGQILMIPMHKRTTSKRETEGIKRTSSR